MPQSFRDELFFEEAPASDKMLAPPGDIHLADVRVEPPLSGQFESDMNWIQQSLEESQARLLRLNNLANKRDEILRRRRRKNIVN